MNIKRSINKRIDKLFGSKAKKTLTPIVNLYGTRYEKSVLVSYIMNPFVTENKFQHQNFITSHIIAQSFSELGYNVDVVEYLGDFILNYDNYDAFFGFGPNFESSFYSAKKEIPRIHFITGAHIDLHNSMSLKSINDFYELSGLWLPDEANVLSNVSYYSTFSSDASIILAQGFVFEDQKTRVNNRSYSLNNNILGVFCNLKAKTKEERNQNFLYLSGARQLTKGLHILLEVAKLRKDINFHIVVFSIDKELDAYYHDVLYNYPNVFLSKNLRMDSEEMKKILETCSYCITPTYVDGLPGGTIEPMSAGLIPIVSKFCGFPREEFIFELEDLSVPCLNEMIDRVLNLDDETYINYSYHVRDYTQKFFSSDSVKSELLKILKIELSEYRGDIN